VALAVVLAHGNSWASPFHFDDFHAIVDNVWLRSLGHVPRYFVDLATSSPLVENRAYRPVLLVGFAISHALGGGAPWGYHLVTLLLHFGGALLAGAIIARVLRVSHGVAHGVAHGVGLVGALIVAVHPLVTEPVSYVSARASLQAGVLSWLAILLWMKAREDGRRALFAGAVVALAAALGTQIAAIAAPLVIVAWELALGPSRARFGRFLPLVLLLIVLAQLLGARSLESPEVLLRFLGLFVWPEDLSADLTMPLREAWWQGPVARAIALHLAIVLFALAVARKRPAVIFGVAWFYLMLSQAPLSESAAEHRAYAAIPGILLALGGLVASSLLTLPRRAIAAALAALWIAILGSAAHARNRVWQSELALWADVIRQSPDNGRAHLNYGLAQRTAGDLAGARQSFERCAEAWPRYAFCDINQAVLALDERRLPDAERSIARAERLLPDNVYVRLWRGNVERAAERWVEAEAAYRGALALAPQLTSARNGLAFALFMQSRIEEATPLFDALSAEGQLDANGLYARGFLADRAGESVIAAGLYRAALALEPTHPRAGYNLAVLLQKGGDLLGAITAYDGLRSRGAATPDALYNLASALWAVGQADRARTIKLELLMTAPDYPRLSGLVF